MNDARCYTSSISDSVDEATMKAFDELKEKAKRSAKAFWHLDKLARSAGFDCCIFTPVNLTPVNLPNGYTAFAFLKQNILDRNADVYLLAYEDGNLLHNNLQNYTYYDGILTQIAEQLIASKKIMLVHIIYIDKHGLNSTVKVDENAKPIELNNNAAQCFLFDVMLEGWLAD